jgi:hypothetical protein
MVVIHDWMFLSEESSWALSKGHSLLSVLICEPSRYTMRDIVMRKSNTAMNEAILLGSRALFSKKLAAGNNSMAKRKENNKGISTL